MLRYLILYQNIVFPAEDNCSYFSADYRLKYSCENSKIISYDISVFQCICCMDGVKEISKQTCKSDVTHVLNFALIFCCFLASFAV